MLGRKVSGTTQQHLFKQQHITIYSKPSNSRSDKPALLITMATPRDSPQNARSDPSQEAQRQADNAWFQNLQSRIQNPSSRNPNLSWESNTADLIERQLQEDGHQTWGFVIYRTTYASDAEWAEFLRRLRFQMDDTFEYIGGRDILDKFVLKIFEDQGLFDNVSTDTIRRHFQQWSSAAYRTEQQHPEHDRSSSSSRVQLGRSPRYHFAVQVDAEALHSIVHDAPAPPELDVTKKGWVKLIDKSWYLGRSEGRERPLEPIEGVTEPDVGWVKVAYQNVMTDWYTMCRSANNWGLNYRRPPQVV